MEASQTPSTHPVMDVLREEHLSLEHAFCELLERAYEGDRDELRASFRGLEAELRAHLALEESSLLPAFERKDPTEAERLRLEHELIRGQLDQLGVALDLGAVRAHVLRDFVNLLRNHALRESELMYKWADGALEEPRRRPLLHWLAERTGVHARAELAAAS